MKRVAPFLVALLVAACAGDTSETDAAAGEALQPAEASAPAPALPPEVEAAKLANEKYADVSVALAEGFIEDPSGLCVMSTDVGAPAELGGMGIHYVNLARLGSSLPEGDGPPPPDFRLSGTDGIIDVNQPEVLVYEPTADGGRTLVAVEYLVFQQAWQDAGNMSPPTIAGHEFFAMQDDPATEMDEAHGFEPHYELHVWTYRDNPSGLFSEWNPNVSCANATPPQGMPH